MTAATDSRQADPHAAPGGSTAALRLLVVDDSAVDRRLAGAIAEKKRGMSISYAADGAEALQALERERPAAVLTDLQMPQMDGLQLVQAIRKQHPLIPVILMTAHGSEQIAIEALRKGAASYVPKQSLARDLAQTLDQVLAAAHTDAEHQRLLECLTQTESQLVLENDSSLIAPLIGHIQANAMRMRLCDETGLIQLTVALREALVNAIDHGNLELSSELREQHEDAYYDLQQQRRREIPYGDRRVYVTAIESRAEAVYMIRDEGPGFDPTRLPDPRDPANLGKVSGRGLLLIRTFMDEVTYNDKANEITLVKRAHPSAGTRPPRSA